MSSISIPLLKRLGRIDYSLYIIHGFVIGIITNQGIAILSDSYIAHVLVLTCGVSISLLAAMGLNRFVESPANNYLTAFATLTSVRLSGSRT